MAVNEDRVEGAGRDMFGKVERVAGDATGSDRLKADGLIDQVTGTIQHGYGETKDVVAAATGAVPSAISGAVEEGRQFARRADGVLRDTLGEHRHFYVLAGAIGLLALAVAYAGRQRDFES
jgi:uncharacterized protein YjbJ (UPF0337 family)